MDIKLIACDLDGTLLSSDNKVSDENVKAFLKAGEKGIIPVIATGRPQSQTGFVTEKICKNGYLIALNGAFIYDINAEKVIYNYKMEREVALNVINYLESFEDIFYQVYANDDTFCSEKAFANINKCGFDESYIEMYKKLQKVVLNNKEHIIKNDIQVDKFFISMKDEQRANEVRANIKNIKGVKALSASRNWLEIIPENIDKAHSLKMLCDILNIDMSQVAAIGDSENDIGMLSEAKIKIAVKNAYDSVIKIADYVVPSNNDNGVAYAIENIILK